eukprot:TRINITY_DN774132_c0_g1_i1.p1 TRINITY_DN774132_c0_g1~~TRINITY_DN774132_c0_g1_i1.p1  ORF type:complete len:481 (+),score=166.88 TRINITY_DN774132_c0_g1_i1:93-1535(+)
MLQRLSRGNNLFKFLRCSSSVSDLVGDLENLLGKSNISTGESQLSMHGRCEGPQEEARPDVVCFPSTNEEVSEIVKLCNKFKTPIVPYGIGSSLEGHTQALKGGVSIDLQNMADVLDVYPEDIQCRVQAGIKRVALNEYLRDTGLFFTVDPGADATLGGMAACRASGTTAACYGTMKDNIMGLTVVMPNGDIVKTGGRAPKSSAGYDMTSLMVGSEGTLGVITEIHLKLHGQPEHLAAATVSFETMDDAVNMVMELKMYGIQVARCEFMDGVQVAAVNKFSGTTLTEKPTLVLEFHGSPTVVKEQIEMVEMFAADNNGSEFKWAEKAEERTKLWHARHEAMYASMNLRPGKKCIITDVCVPVSKLSECILGARDDLDAAGLCAPIVGHVGDGNFHAFIVVDFDDKDELEAAEKTIQGIVDRALELGGTCTGEHGVGSGKIKYLKKERGMEALESMALIKKALDPMNLFNPGKVIPAELLE